MPESEHTKEGPCPESNDNHVVAISVKNVETGAIETAKVVARDINWSEMLEIQTSGPYIIMMRILTN